MPDTLERLTLSPDEVARSMGISRPKVYDLIAQEGLPSFKIGRRTVIPVCSLKTWIAKQAENGGGEIGL